MFGWIKMGGPPQREIILTAEQWKRLYEDRGLSMDRLNDNYWWFIDEVARRVGCKSSNTVTILAKLDELVDREHNATVALWSETGA